MNYNEFIHNIITERGQWNIPDGAYYEVHHIVPKCMGGDGVIKRTKNGSHHPNLIFLYPKEHFIAHKLLALENPDNIKLISAWSMMAFPKGKTKRNNKEITADDYAILREMLSKKMTGRYVCEETRKKLSVANVGKSLPEETRRKISEKNKGKIVSESVKRKIAETKSKRNYHYVCPNKGKRLVTNGVVDKYIDKDDLVPDGFYFGTRNRGKKHDMSKHYEFLSNGGVNKFSRFGKSNGMYGRSDLCSDGKNSHATKFYCIDGQRFECRKELVKYLQFNGFDTVSVSTIRKIEQNAYHIRIEKKYKYIIDNLVWGYKKDEDKEC